MLALQFDFDDLAPEGEVRCLPIIFEKSRKFLFETCKTNSSYF